MRVDLSGAQFCEADLSGANLSGANLLDVDLTGALLAGANLLGAKNLGRARLQGAIFDRRTRWEGWFDLRDRGVVLRG